MGNQVFHDTQRMVIYQRAFDLACKVILIADGIKPYRLAEQIAGSVISIASNISEGAERSPKEFLRYLDFSRGSAAELATQLNIAIVTKRYNIEELQKHLNETQELRKMLYAFQSQLKKRVIDASH